MCPRRHISSPRRALRNGDGSPPSGRLPTNPSSIVRNRLILYRLRGEPEPIPADIGPRKAGLYPSWDASPSQGTWGHPSRHLLLTQGTCECRGWYRGPWLCLITGASRGFGAAFTGALSEERLGPGSLLLLSARSLGSLRLLAHRLLAQRHEGPPGGQGCLGGDPLEERGPHEETEQRGPQQDAGSLLVSCPGGCLRFLCVAANLEGPEGVQALEAALRTQDRLQYRRMLVLNNAGSLGDVSRRVCEVTPAQWGPLCCHLQLNVAAPLLLAGAALRWFHGPREGPGDPDALTGDGEPSGRVATVVNVSSLCAVVPFASWAPYCTSRAARDMLHVVMATEEPHARVLNYAPGPMDTEMQAEARASTGDAGVRGRLAEASAAGSLVEPRRSALALLRLLRADAFASGAHVDYYDVPPASHSGGAP